MNLPMKDGGRCTSRQNPPTHSTLRSGARKAANALASARAVWAPKKLRRPAAWAVVSALKNSRRNRRESTRTGRKKPGRQDTQREPSGTTRHDHVHMRMVGQCRAPGVQHRGDADTGAE